jgi:hypothetical protein
MTVSDNGGNPEPLVKGISSYIVSPQILPDGKHVMYTDLIASPTGVMVQSIHSGEKKELVIGDIARISQRGISFMR